MSPVLNAGDYVATSTWWLKLRVGSLVVVSHPQYQTIVKRIAELRHDGAFLLSGENAASVDSEQMGWLTKGDLLGVVLFCIKK